MDALVSLRGRAAYWEKRIALAGTVKKKQQCRMFAWAELARLVLREGLLVYEPNGAVFEQAVVQHFAVLRRMTGSRPKKSSGRTARAAIGRASRATG